MVSERQRIAREKFVKRFAGRKGKARKTKGRTQARKTKVQKVRIMAPRSAYYKRKIRNFRRNRQNVVPLMDGLHGVYTIDGLMDGNLNKAIQSGFSALNLTRPDSKGMDDAFDNLQTGVKVALKDPKNAIFRGVKNFGTIFLLRKALEFIGVPRTVKIWGKTRLQIR